MKPGTLRIIDQQYQTASADRNSLTSFEWLFRLKESQVRLAASEIRPRTGFTVQQQARLLAVQGVCRYLLADRSVPSWFDLTLSRLAVLPPEVLVDHPVLLLGMVLGLSTQQQHSASSQIAFCLGMLSAARMSNPAARLAEMLCLWSLGIDEQTESPVSRQSARVLGDLTTHPGSPQFLHCIASLEFGRALRRNGDHGNARRWVRLAGDAAGKADYPVLLAKAESGPVGGAISLAPTAREMEVLGYIALGFSDTDTARILGLSTHTVSNHIRHIRGKIGAATRAEAVAWAVTRGLIPTQGME